MPSGDGLTAQHPLPCCASHLYAHCPTPSDSTRIAMLPDRVGTQSRRSSPTVLAPIVPLLPPPASQHVLRMLHWARLRINPGCQTLLVRTVIALRVVSALRRMFYVLGTIGTAVLASSGARQPFGPLLTARHYRMQQRGRRRHPLGAPTRDIHCHTLDPGATPNRTQSLTETHAPVNPPATALHAPSEPGAPIHSRAVHCSAE
jgi:hypothetical protein